MRNILICLAVLIGICQLRAQEVEVIGDLKITNGSQGQGKVLVSDENGLSNWMSKTDLLIDLHKDLDGGLERLIMWGISPVEMWNFGVPYDSLIGVNISTSTNFGDNNYIFYIDTLDIHSFEYLATANEGATYNSWACDGNNITGADSQLLGDGYQNTQDVITDCPSPPNSSSIFTQYVNAGSDVHIASVDEASLIYTTLILPGIYDPSNGNGTVYWTSSEAQGVNEATHAMVIDKSTGAISEELKSFSTRAILVKQVN